MGEEGGDPAAPEREPDAEPWKIMGPAIKLPSGKIVGGYGFTGHPDVRDSLSGKERDDADGPDRVDGFLDNRGRFVDRETARRLTGASRGETTEIARTDAGSPIRDLYREIMAEWLRGDREDDP